MLLRFMGNPSCAVQASAPTGTWLVDLHYKSANPAVHAPEDVCSSQTHRNARPMRFFLTRERSVARCSVLAFDFTSARLPRSGTSRTGCHVERGQSNGLLVLESESTGEVWMTFRQRRCRRQGPRSTSHCLGNHSPCKPLRVSSDLISRRRRGNSHNPLAYSTRSLRHRQECAATRPCRRRPLRRSKVCRKQVSVCLVAFVGKVVR